MFEPKWQEARDGNSPDFASRFPLSKPAPTQLPLEMPPTECPPSCVQILLVNGDAALRAEMAAALRSEGCEVREAESGAAALNLLHQAEFDALISDVTLPDSHGLDLLRDALALHPELPFIFVAAQASIELARQTLTQGASDFITQAAAAADLPLVVERSLTRQALQRKAALRNKIALQSSNESVLDALLSALNTRDTETQGHSERVTAYTMELADRLELSADELYPIERGALLHDIGAIGVPDRILQKPGKLTPEEWVEVRKHPVIGYQMCARVDILQTAAQIILRHHEAWDGSGYPDGLRGEAILLGARIFAIADALDAMTSDRPYRAALPLENARAEIEACAGRQFDPELVRLFRQISDARLRQIRALADK